MEIRKLSEIKPNPNNPRLIKDEKFSKLVESLRSFPEMANVRPIVVNTDMVILGGNMRYKAMKEAGWKQVPVEVVDWPEDKQREFIIKDNVGFGEWDWNDLANNWDAEQLEEWGMTIPNWSAGIDENNMNEDALDLTEEFDPIGISKGLVRLVIIFDGMIEAKDWIEKNVPKLEYKKKGNDENIILQVNLSTKYGI